MLSEAWQKKIMEKLNRTQKAQFEASKPGVNGVKGPQGLPARSAPEACM